MKRIINLVLITITIATVNTIDARMVSTPVSVTRNTKQMLTDTKALQAAQTAEEKAKAARKLAKDMQNDEYSLLKIEEKHIQKDIKDKNEEIAQAGGGYFSYFDSDEATELKNELTELKEELIETQNKLNQIRGTQTKVETRLKDYALYTLIGTVTLGVAAHLITGGTSTTAILTGANTAGTAIAGKVKSMWDYFRPSTETVPTEGSSSVGSMVTAGAGTLASYAAALAAAQAKAYFIDKALATAMAFIAGADENTDQDKLQKTKADAARLTAELNETNAQIEKLKDAQLEEQVAQQRNL